MTGKPGAGKSYESVAHTIMPALAAGRRVVTNIPLDIQVIGVVLAKQITASGWSLPDARAIFDAGGRLAADGYLNEDGRARDLAKIEHVESAVKAIAEPAELRMELWAEPDADVLYFPSDVWRTPPKPSKGEAWQARAHKAAQDVRRMWFAGAIDLPGALFVLDEVWRLWPSGMRQDTVPVDERRFLAEHRHAVADGRSQEIALLVQSERNISSWPLEQVDHWVQLVKLNKLGIRGGYKARIWDSVDRDRTLLRKEVRRYDPRYWRCYQSATRAMLTSVARVDGDGIRFDVEQWQIGRPFARAHGVGDEEATDSRASLFGAGRGAKLALGGLAAVAAVAALGWWFLSGGGVAGVGGDDAAAVGGDDAAAVRIESAPAVHDQPLRATAADAAGAAGAGEDTAPGAPDAGDDQGIGRAAIARAALATATRRGQLAELVAAFDGPVALEPSWWRGATTVEDKIAMCAAANCGRIELARVAHVRVAECIAEVAGRLVLCGSVEKAGEEETEAGVDLAIPPT